MLDGQAAPDARRIAVLLHGVLGVEVLDGADMIAADHALDKGQNTFATWHPSPPNGTADGHPPAAMPGQRIPILSA
jgi:hypothetical protein